MEKALPAAPVKEVAKAAPSKPVTIQADKKIIRDSSADSSKPADDFVDPFAPVPASATKPVAKAAESGEKADSLPTPLPSKPAANQSNTPSDDPFAPLPAANNSSSSTAKPSAKAGIAKSGAKEALKVAAVPKPAVVKPVVAKPVAVKAVAPAAAASKAVAAKTVAILPPKSADATVVKNEPMRLWHDDTGEFAVRGKLILLMPGKVRLLKDTGRTTTVPLDRLSKADLAYVERHTTAMLAKLTAQ